MTAALNNNGKHIRKILDGTACERHEAATGFPCWWIYGGSTTPPTLTFAACGSRIRKAGYNGKVNPESLASNRRRGRS